MNRAINTLTRWQTELMMWTEGFHVFLLDLLSSFTRPDGPALRKRHLTHISQRLGSGRVSSYLVQKQNTNGPKCDDGASDVAQKLPFIISKRIQSTAREKASVASALFTFKQSLISYFATHNQQTTNYRVDIPRVLQRFSINCKPVSQTTFVSVGVCVRVCM